MFNESYLPNWGWDLHTVVVAWVVVVAGVVVVTGVVVVAGVVVDSVVVVVLAIVVTVVLISWGCIDDVSSKNKRLNKYELNIFFPTV